MSRHRLLCSTLVVGPLLCGCGTQATGPAPSGFTAEGGARSRLGYLEHRGRQYAVEDLLDAEMRAKSDDPFVRSFTPDTTYVLWAGRHAPPVWWAGTNERCDDVEQNVEVNGPPVWWAGMQELPDAGFLDASIDE